MSFISAEFAALVAITFVFYYAAPLHRVQVPILVVASLVFYAWDQWRLLPLLLFAATVTYFSMRLGALGSRRGAICGIVANLVILAFFKYKFLFLGATGSTITGLSYADALLMLPLPIGISFFVFHDISLIADCFKSKTQRPIPRFADVIIYIMFFPQLVSGPITRAASFLPQISRKYLADVPLLQCAELIVIGLFFKLFCANNLAQATALISAEHAWHLRGGDKLILLFAYSFQIYADFFGYSTIALGLALLFGYRLPVNFRLPYTAASFSDFWKRGHISLSMWLRQYLYVPLGGSRSGRFRTYLNLMIVMGLGGLWHGAALSFGVWGLAHGLLLTTERAANDLLGDRIRSASGIVALRCGYAFFVFVCVSVLWTFFRFTSFADAVAYLGSMATDLFHLGQGDKWYLYTAIYASPVIVQHALAGRRPRVFQHAIVYGAFLGFLLFLAFAERGADTQFIYFRF
jgi:alginate O-acetyltransferase complex protein AlgI